MRNLRQENNELSLQKLYKQSQEKWLINNSKVETSHYYFYVRLICDNKSIEPGEKNNKQRTPKEFLDFEM